MSTVVCSNCGAVARGNVWGTLACSTCQTEATYPGEPEPAEVPPPPEGDRRCGECAYWRGAGHPTHRTCTHPQAPTRAYRGGLVRAGVCGGCAV